MRHIYLTIALLLAVCFAASARQISENEAMLKAAAFGQKAVASRLMSTSRSSAMTLAYTQQSATSAADNCFYVFNRGKGEGYIIASADDRAVAILGYTDSGTFDYASLPENARWWLSEYQREIQYLIDHPTAIGNALLPMTLTTSVKPLCRSLWNQNSPFNDNCPTYTDTTTNTTVHCATGCVATATCQVMYYYKWPISGTGSHSYTSKNTYGSKALTYDLSADFSQSTYDWANMVEAYNSTATTEQKAAVAKLMSDVGISLDMRYSRTSGAAEVYSARSLYNYFGYDKGMTYTCRDYCPAAEWDSKIRTELDNARPVIYGGTGNGGGHSFVCDGYNSDGYFHFNWGWGGVSNGYFVTTALDPTSQGIGGNTSGFDRLQELVTNIKIAKTGSKSNYYLVVDSITPVDTTVSLGSQVKEYVVGFWNKGWQNFTGPAGYITYNSAGTIVDRQVATDTLILAPYHGYKAGNITYTVPTGLADGTYKVRLGILPAESTDSTDWQFINSKLGQAQSLIVTVSGGTAKVTTSVIGSTLTATNFSASGTIRYKNGCTFNATIANAGGEYNGPVYLVQFSSTGSAVGAVYNVLDLAGGESTTTKFLTTIAIPAGTGYVQLYDNKYKAISNLLKLTVDTTSVPALTLTKAISFTDNANVPQDNLQLTATIHNTGGCYSNLVYGIVFPATGGNMIGRIQTGAYIESGDSVTVNLSGGLATGVPGTKYAMVLYYLNPSNSLIQFTPKENSVIYFTLNPIPSGVNSIGATSNRIFPNPATDAVTIENVKPITGIQVYSATGALVLTQKANKVNSLTLNVASLPAGSYIVRVANEAGITVQRFIKR
jgi:hypothetical protein